MSVPGVKLTLLKGVATGYYITPFKTGEGPVGLLAVGEGVTGCLTSKVWSVKGANTLKVSKG